MKNFVRRAMPLSARLWPFTSALSGRVTPASEAAPAGTVRSREGRAEYRIRIGSSNEGFALWGRSTGSLAESQGTSAAAASVSDDHEDRRRAGRQHPARVSGRLPRAGGALRAARL